MTPAVAFETALAKFNSGFTAFTSVQLTATPMFTLGAIMRCIADNTLLTDGDAFYPGCLIPEDGFEGLSKSSLIERREMWQAIESSAMLPDELLSHCKIRPVGYAFRRGTNREKLPKIEVSRPGSDGKVHRVNVWAFPVLAVLSPNNDVIGYATGAPCGSLNRCKNILKAIGQAILSNPNARVELITGSYEGAAGSVVSVRTARIHADTGAIDVNLEWTSRK